ncbi:phage tail sheath family protein [Aquamicrobium zhengzhouense]|uniref:Phage tail protein n=1 Tax=Aquamicrobium zhengzhouense TaxID=2781738 RepID=A0ABS0SA47_9HYPH|nr:phage tail protein [Aquamicrobium zhengzhouense]MBI1620165.1 phage tail protein [Aquamicrobium zhengzhouense]
MTSPHFGMTFSRPQDEPVPTLGADFSKVLLIEISNDADPEVFALDEPVRFSSSDPRYTSKLGTGPLADAVRAINSQLSGLNAGADVTVVRVAEGTSENPRDALEETSANIMEALENVSSIPSHVNATPRLVWAGRTAWRPDANTANPVVAALPAALEKLLAVAAVDVDDSSAEEAIDARETMNSQRLIPIGIAGRVFEGTDLVTRPMGPRIAGLFIRTDNDHGGKPFNPIANRPIQGLAGLSRKLPFSLLDGSTEGQQMLEANVSIVAEGEVGVDGSIADGGFVFIGTDNTETGELWRQIHQVRGADYLTVKMMQITRQFLGRKITADLTEAWLNSLKFMLRDHKAADDILGYDVGFRRDRNSPEQIRLGHLTVNLGIEPAPAFKLANHEIRRYRPAVEGLVQEIIARLNAAV